MIFEDNEDMEENLSHKSYKEYKKELGTDKKPNESLIIFISVFFVMLLLFLGLAKRFSPDVDVNISSEDEVKSEQMEDDIETGSVDGRLKDLQMEDKSAKTDETFSAELDEKVVLPEKQRKTIGEQKNDEAENPTVENKQSKTVNTPERKAEPTVASVNAKVVVGYYTTKEQAEVAKGIIEDAGFHPFVRTIGEAYTLQVGSFNTKEKAYSAANDLLRKNFPARVIVE